VALLAQRLGFPDQRSSTGSSQYDTKFSIRKVVRRDSMYLPALPQATPWLPQIQTHPLRPGCGQIIGPGCGAELPHWCHALGTGCSLGAVSAVMGTRG
jgi:hypothetical protein